MLFAGILILSSIGAIVFSSLHDSSPHLMIPNLMIFHLMIRQLLTSLFISSPQDSSPHFIIHLITSLFITSPHDSSSPHLKSHLLTSSLISSPHDSSFSSHNLSSSHIIIRHCLTSSFVMLSPYYSLYFFLVLSMRFAFVI